MQDIISAIIIDKNKTNHDYSNINSSWFKLDGEQYFKLEIFENCDNILDYLYKNRTIDCIITIGENDYKVLNDLSFEFRKKWVYLNEFDELRISEVILSVLSYNINRDRKGNELFSIFTCAYKTSKEMAERLYNSLLNQTYKNWNWWIIDDTPFYDSYFTKFIDPRIHIIRNHTNHGNIGFNKHLIAMVCDGDYLLEVDHDDELMPDCLEKIKLAFDTYPDCDFVYTYCIEEIDNKPVYYGEYFELGLGEYVEEIFNGEKYRIPNTPDVNALSMRHIISLPNHARCWKKDFYHKIGGHNTELSILDDMDLLIRTIIHGKTCKIPKFLYIQHEGTTNDGNERGSSTQAHRFGEIRRLGEILRIKYSEEIHKFLVEKGGGDPYWNEEGNYADIYSGVKEGTIPLNYTLNV